MPDSKQVTVTFSEEVVARLECLANRRGVTLKEALSQAILDEVYIHQ